MAENDDGKPHFTYFDSARQLSFVWSGGPEIEVCPDGYGEPAQARIPVPISWSRDITTLSMFHAMVLHYIAQVDANDGELLTQRAYQIQESP